MGALGTARVLKEHPRPIRAMAAIRIVAAEAFGLTLAGRALRRDLDSWYGEARWNAGD